jgi:hypothetical protein
LSLKINYLKGQGQDSSATRLVQREMGSGARPEREGEMRRGKKSRLMREVGPKEVREYRKEPLIFRI